MLGAGVLDRIAQRLLDDPVDRGLGVGSQAPLGLEIDRDVDREARRSPPGAWPATRSPARARGRRAPPDATRRSGRAACASRRRGARPRSRQPGAARPCRRAQARPTAPSAPRSTPEASRRAAHAPIAPEPARQPRRSAAGGRRPPSARSRPRSRRWPRPTSTAARPRRRTPRSPAPSMPASTPSVSPRNISGTRIAAGRTGRELLELRRVLRPRRPAAGAPVSNTWPASEPSTGSRGCDSDRSPAAAHGRSSSPSGRQTTSVRARHDLAAVLEDQRQDAFEVGLAADRARDLGERLQPLDALGQLPVGALELIGVERQVALGVAGARRCPRRSRSENRPTTTPVTRNAAPRDV